MENKRIINALKKTKESKQKLFEFLNEIDYELLLKKNDPQSWSIMQVLTHLKDAESGTLGYMSKKMGVVDQLKNCGWKSSINSLLLQISLYLPIKFKAPKVVSNPEVTMNYSNFKDNYMLLEGKLKDLIGEMAPEHMDKAIYKHPFVGKLNVIQALRFQRAHLLHHRKQILRILKANWTKDITELS